MNSSRKEEFEKLNRLIDDININIYNIEKIIGKGNNNLYYKSENKNNGLIRGRSNNIINKTEELIKYIKNEVDLTNESINELKEPFLLFVVGQGNYGKSTLVNALLGEKVIKTSNIPNTWKIDLFIKSTDKKIELEYKDKTRVLKSYSNGIRMLNNEEEKYNKSKRNISEKIKIYRKSNNVDIEKIKQYKKELEEKELYVSEITQTKYFLNNTGIIDDFIIVDTPGLNQTLLGKNMDRARSYYKRADGVIWLIDIQNIVSAGSNKTIKEIFREHECNEIKTYYETNETDTTKNMILVVNKIDTIKKNSERDFERIKKEIEFLYKDYFKDIVFISAKQAINGIILNNNSLLLESNINKLYESIEKNFKQASVEYQIKSKYKNISIMRNNIELKVDEYKRQLYKDFYEYSRIESVVKSKISKLDYFIKTKLENLDSYSSIKKITQTQLNSQIKSLEEICNKKLDKIYQSAYIMSLFSLDIDLYKEKPKLNYEKKLCFQKKIYISANLSRKSKDCNSQNNYLKPIEGIFNSKTHLRKNNEKNRENELLIRENQYKIKYLREEILKEFNYKTDTLVKEINNFKNENFKSLYLDYTDVKSHIEYIDNIEVILES